MILDDGYLSESETHGYWEGSRCLPEVVGKPEWGSAEFHFCLPTCSGVSITEGEYEWLTTLVTLI